MSSEIAIKVQNLNKQFQIYDQPRDRLKQFFLPRMQRLRGQLIKQYYREFQALKDVSFDISKCETVGIIGRNGSGKSTLLQLICGVLNPSSGTVRSSGRIAALLELGAGFNPAFTGRENVLINGAILGLSEAQIRERFDKIADFAGIGSFIDQPVSTYSSGMYVRLAFAVMAHVDAEILVIDEALAVGDVFFTQKCMRFLRGFQENGTVLFVSHDAGAVVNLCSRAIWLEQGEIREIGPAHHVCEKYLASQYDAQTSAKKVEREKLVQHPLINNESSSSDQPYLSTAGGYDMRLDFINTTTLRNDIQVFRFDTQGRNFGMGGARVIDAYLCNHAQKALTWVIGGEEAAMVVRVSVETRIEKIIIGFFVKDRLGQVLFGENTYLTYAENPVSASPGETIEAYFSFRMPILPRGSYAIDVAIADGTHEQHRQLQWIHDAFVLESHTSSTSTGLIGIPFGKIELRSNSASHE